MRAAGLLFLLSFCLACPAAAQEADLKEAEAHNNRGARLAHEGRYGEAVEAFKRAVRLAPDLVAAHYNLGLAYLGLEDYARAQAAFETAVRIRPDNGDVWLQLGRALLAQDKHGEASQACQMALRFKPNSPDVRYWFGIASWKQGDWAQAAAQWEALIVQHPDHPAAPKAWRELPRAYYNLGTAREADGRLEDAERAYREAIRLRGDYAEAFSALAGVCRAQGRLGEAAGAFRKALELRPEDPALLSGLGDIYVLQDSLDRAVAQYRAALRAQEDYLDARYGLANALLRQGKVAAAEQEAGRVLAQAPEDARSYRLLAYVYEHNAEGVRYGPGYRAGEAIAAYERALRLEQNDASLYFNLGVVYGREENWIHARAAFLRALEIDSTHAEVRRWLPVVEANMIDGGGLKLKVVKEEEQSKKEDGR